MMSLWARFEDLVLEYMEARVAEMLDRGDVTSPKVIAHVRETAAWAAERAVARFQASLKKGSGFPEKVFVFNTNSQHAYGNAVDIDSTGRNFITPDFAAWARTHDRELHAAGEFDKTLIFGPAYSGVDACNFSMFSQALFLPSSLTMRSKFLWPKASRASA
jgi:hypothetical protein